MASFTPPVVGQANSSEDPKIATALTVLDNLLDSSDLVPSAGLAGNIAHSKLSNATAAQLMLFNGSGVATATTVTGDVTVTSSGVTAIGTDKVTTAMIGASQVGNSEMADNAVGEEEITTALAETVGATETSTTRRDYAEVLTEESLDSSSWTDLATAGPSVTVTCPANGFALVGASVDAKSDGCSVGVHAGIDRAISGAVEPGEAIIQPRGDSVSGAYLSLPQTGLMLVPVTAGSRTFTLKYADNIVGSLLVKNRKLWVVAFGGF